MSDEQEVSVTERTTVQSGHNPNIVKPWHILLVSAIAILAWIGFSIWVLTHHATEAERASILKVAETFATAGFFYYLGSSAGSRNKEHR